MTMSNAPRSLVISFVIAATLAGLPGQRSGVAAQAEAVQQGRIQVFGQPIRGHHAEVTSAHYRPDGKQALTASQDGTIKVWNTADGSLVRSLTGHQGGVWRAFFYDAGSKIVSIGRDQHVRFFDAAKGTELGRIGALPEQLKSPLLMRLNAALTPDGKELYVADIGQRAHDRLLRFDLASRKQLDTLVIEGGHHMRHFAFSADGKYIVLPQSKEVVSGHLSLYDRTAGKLVYSIPGPRASRAAFHADGVHFLLVGARALEVRKTADGSVVSSLRGFSDVATGFAMVPDGSRVYLGFSFDSMLLGVDLGNKRVMFQYGEFLDSVNAIDLAPDHQTLIAGGPHGAVRFLDADSGEEQFQPPWHQNRVQAVGVSKDGRHVVSGTYDNEVIVWDGQSRKVAHEIHEHRYAILGAGFSANGHAVSASNDNAIHLIDPQSGEVLKSLEAGEGTKSMQSFAIGPQGAFAVSGHRDGTVIVWDLKIGAEAHRMRCGKGAVAALTLGKGRFAAAIDGQVLVFRFGASEPTATIAKLAKGEDEDSDDVAVTALAYLPWDHLAIGHGNGKVRVFKVGEAAPKKTLLLDKDGGYVSALRVVGDVLFAANPGAVHSLGTDDLEPVRPAIRAFASGVLDLAPDAAGKLLFAAMSDGTVLRLDLGRWD